MTIFAAISDIHGNALALEAVLADIRSQGIADIVNLGDSLSGPLQAGRTADILLDLALPTVRGNHDRALIDRPFEAMGDWEPPAFLQMRAVHFDWIKSLPETLVYRDEAFLCHATPADDNTYWMETVSPEGLMHLRPIEEIAALAEGHNYPLLLSGHTHIARSVRLGDGRLLVNPGSVGCPGFDYDQPVYHKAEAGHPFACYAVLEKREGLWQASFRQVRYDWDAAAEMARKQGMADWASVLSTGWLR
jgi:predicted phosphodiesterase